MATRDGRIGAMMGGVSRTVGNDTMDLGALERRRAQADKLQRPAPQVPFAEVLAADARALPAPRRPARRQIGDEAREEAAPSPGAGDDTAGQGDGESVEQGAGAGAGGDAGAGRAGESNLRPAGPRSFARPRGRARWLRG